MTRVSRFRPLAALAVLGLAGALAGCYNPFSPRIAPVLGNSKPAPTPTSSIQLLRLFEWCYNNQAIAEYREIFTDDYRFFFSPTDSSGSAWRGTPWTREDELISATQLFVGGSATEPPASSIRLNLDKNFFVFPDNNYPWDPDGRWHQNIRTTVTLVITTEGGSSTEIQGHANFYTIRGDSAVIPPELTNRGFGRDSLRWYIRRWDDETAQEGLAQAALERAVRQAATSGSTRVRRGSGPIVGADAYDVLTWGEVKAYYRMLGSAPLASRTRSRP